MLPGILKGLLNEAIAFERVDTKKAIEWVQTNERLLDHIRITDNPGVRNVIQKLGVKKIDDSWITTQWLLGAVRERHPALYSLMMGWPKGFAWCDRQVADIRLELDKLTPQEKS